MAASDDPRSLLEELRARRPASSPEDREVQWNILERLVAGLDPTTDQLDVVIEVLNEIASIMREMDGRQPPRQPPSGGADPLPDNSVALLQEIARNTNLQIEGFVSTRNLPIGLVGTMASQTDQGSEGQANFEVGGSEMLATVEPDDDVGIGDRVSVIGEGNRVQQVPEERDDASGTAIVNTGLITKVGHSAGKSNALEVKLGSIRSAVDFYYDVTTTGVIHLELSKNGDDWRFFRDIDTAGNDIPNEDTVQIDTAYKWFRGYADSDDFNDDQVTTLELSTKGVT